MNNELELYLAHFKECSLEILDIVEKEKYDELEGKIAERQDIIDSMEKLSYTKEEISKLFEEFELGGIFEKINEIINNKKTRLKAEIQENAIKKNASTNYNRILNNNFHVFSKKV